MPQAPLHVFLIAGSAERPSRVRATLDLLQQELQSLAAAVTLWDLYERPLPLLKISTDTPSSRDCVETIDQFAALALQADAFIWGSPTYHNSFSGILKNALDCLSIDHVRDKPIALISNGSNDRTGSQPCDQLRIVARGLLGITIPTQAITLSDDFVRTQSGYRLVNEAIGDRIRRLAQELCSYARLMRPLRSTSFNSELSIAAAGVDAPIADKMKILL